MPGWIQVGTKLPKVGEVVLAWSGDYPKPQIVVFRGEDQWKYEGEEHFALAYVTHWMPLPEPPETRPKRR